MTIRITATSIGASTDYRGGNTPERWHAATYPEGDVILEDAREPFTEAARKLLEMGHNPDEPLLLVDPLTGNTRLTSTLGYAAKLTVKETNSGPRFVPYQPRPTQNPDVPRN